MGTKKRTDQPTPRVEVALRIVGADVAEVEAARAELAAAFGGRLKLGRTEAGIGGRLVGGYSAYGTLRLARALTEAEVKQAASDHLAKRLGIETERLEAWNRAEPIRDDGPPPELRGEP